MVLSGIAENFLNLAAQRLRPFGLGRTVEDFASVNHGGDIGFHDVQPARKLLLSAALLDDLASQLTGAP
jgi:hypothetical protein